jgi:myosin heavy subunit
MAVARSSKYLTKTSWAVWCWRTKATQGARRTTAMREQVVAKMAKRVHTILAHKSLIGWHKAAQHFGRLQRLYKFYVKTDHERRLHAAISHWFSVVIEKKNEHHMRERQEEWKEREIERDQHERVKSELQSELARVQSQLQSELQTVKEQLEETSVRYAATVGQVNAKEKEIAGMQQLRADLLQARRTAEQARGEVRDLRAENFDLRHEAEELKQHDASGAAWAERVEEMQRKLAKITVHQKTLVEKEAQLEQALLEIAHVASTHS